MRFPYAIMLASILAGTASAQGSTAWIQNQYPQLQKININTLLGDAAQAGVIQNADELLALKKAFRELRGKSRFGKPGYRFQEFPFITPPASGAQFDVAAEHESNDGWMWADDMGIETSAIGDCSTLNDIDSWKFNSTGGFYSLIVSATGATPIADSILFVRNHKGDPLAFSDNAGASPLSQIHMWLPPGTYYADVAGASGVGGGTYQLSITHDPVPLTPLVLPTVPPTPLDPPLGPFGLQTPGAGIAHDVFEFTLTEDSRFHFTTEDAAHSGIDSLLVIQRADGMIYFTGDDSAASALDAAADIDLPAGTYYAYMSEISGAAIIAIPPDPLVGFLGQGILAHAWRTPITIPDICTLGSATTELIGGESVRLARIELATAQHIDFRTSDGPLAPVFDTILALHDRDLDFLCDVDDDDPFDPLRDGYSRISMSLPAGIYYLAIAPFNGLFGDSTLTGTCSAYTPTGVATFGAFTGAIPGFGDIATYTLDNCSPSTTRFLANNFDCGLMGADGELMSVTLSGPDIPQAGEFLSGQGTIFMWDRFDFSGTLTTTLEPSLHLSGGAVTTRAKVGDVIVLAARFGPLSPPTSIGIGERGLLCLTPGPGLLTVDIVVAPANGLTTWFTPPPLPPALTAYDLQLQQVDVHFALGWGTIPAELTLRNTLGL